MAYIAGSAVAHAGDPGAVSLEELIFEAACGALADAGMDRADIDGVCIAASDQLDGRVISSMHLAGPAGAYLRDEVKVADDGSLAFAAAVLRLEAGVSHRVLAVSWTKAETSPESAAAPNPDPLYERQTGVHPLVAEALVAQMFAHRHAIPLERFDELAGKLSSIPPGQDPVYFRGHPRAPGAVISWPLRTTHLPPATDGAVALVLAAEPAAVEVAGLAWGAEHPDPPSRRLHPEEALAAVAARAYGEAGIRPGDAQAVETTDRNVFWLCISAAGLGLVEPRQAADALLHDKLPQVNPSGGLWSSNPPLAAGLERIAHAAFAAQRDGLAVAHSSYGRAGQGQLVTVLRKRL